MSSNHPKIKLDKFLTMAQYSWHNFARELSHYDLADSMHMLCPPAKHLEGLDFGGFILNITPDIPFETVTQDNIYEVWRERIKDIRQNGKPFDFWGILQCTKQPIGPGYQAHECQMPPEVYEHMIDQVGDLFLGWEIGEWDGLYARDVVYYWKPDEYPKTRREAHDRLVSYLQNLNDMLYRNTNCLCGVTFAHYFNELPVRMLGAEVAQGLLNTQVYVSFLRGACRQYGLQYKIMSSVFDRWGYRCYTDSPGVTLENETGIGVWVAGPHQGHSVGLLQAIWVISYFAEAAIAGLDGSFYTDELADGVRQLSPLGKAFLDFQNWAKDPHPRGRQVRPLALMLDYYAGWAPPRHLYSFKERVVWHSIPYGPADHAMDQVYNTFYPGYSDSGYYRDERGFITPTPDGDVIDVLLTDASLDAMKDYPIIWLISDVIPGEDVMCRLKSYVEDGGHLVLSGPPMLHLLREWFDIDLIDEPVPAVSAFDCSSGAEVREAYYTVRQVNMSSDWTIHYKTESGLPLIASQGLGKGTVSIVTAEHGLTDEMVAPGFDMNRNMDYRPDPPYELLHSVGMYIKGLVRQELPVDIVGSGIYYAVNDLGDDGYVVCAYNPGVEPWTGCIMSKSCGDAALLDGPWRQNAALDGCTLKLAGNETAVFTIKSSRT